jgi:hypothetical protein
MPIFSQILRTGFSNASGAMSNYGTSILSLVALFPGKLKGVKFSRWSFHVSLKMSVVVKA